MTTDEYAAEFVKLLFRHPYQIEKVETRNQTNDEGKRVMTLLTTFRTEIPWEDLQQAAG